MVQDFDCFDCTDFLLLLKKADFMGLFDMIFDGIAQ